MFKLSSTERTSYEDQLLTALRYSLSFIFIWFGLLKMSGFNPVYDLINSVTPFLAQSTGLVILGAFETLIGIGLAFNRFHNLTHLLLLIYLAGTFLVFITGLDVVFEPHFPILSLSGEFVIKNIVLIVAGLLILIHELRKKRKSA